MTVLKPGDYTQYDNRMKSDLNQWVAYHQALWATPNKLTALLTEKPLSPHHLTPSQQSRLKKVPPRYVKNVLAWLDSDPHHHLMRITDADYPPLLKEIADPPTLLYIIGDRSQLTQHQIALVGSRRPTLSGQQIAHEFAAALASHARCITSGLARGIDAQAHLGALSVQGISIAVLGCGVDIVYPKQNKHIYHDIAKSGAIISEYPLGMPPLATNFPRRNRLISGLSHAVLVIEAARRSGSLITAYCALDQGRDVMAIPGSIRQPQSAGCHQLIQEGAKLITSTDDVLNEMGAESLKRSPLPPEDKDPSLDQDEHLLLECLGFDTWSVQSLCDHLNVSPQTICTQLLKLELHGYIKAVPGGVSRVK